MRIFIATVLVLFSFNAFADKDCLTNFTSEGFMIPGKTYKTFGDFPAINSLAAIQQVYKSLLIQGFLVTKFDEENGEIFAVRANGTVNQGSHDPYHIIATQVGTGTHLSLIYKTIHRRWIGEEAIQNIFCGTMNVAKNAGNVAPPRLTLPNLAPVTYDQSLTVANRFEPRTRDEQLKAQIREARVTITNILLNVSCLKDDQAEKILSKFSVSDDNLNHFNSPMLETKKHDQHVCLDVDEIKNWSSPSDTVLKFDVVFKADDSDEEVIRSYEMHRIASAVWKLN